MLSTIALGGGLKLHRSEPPAPDLFHIHGTEERTKDRDDKITFLFHFITCYGLWWLFLRSAERQILAAQETFIEALEEHDWEKVSLMLAPDFVGPRGLNAQTAMTELQKALGGFVTLDIEAQEPTVQASPKLGVSTQRIKVIGLGSSFAIAVRERANQLQTP